MSKHHIDCTCETRIWRCDRQRLVRLQYSRWYQSSQIFRITKPNDYKNLTFDAVSFFLLDARIFLIAAVPLAKIMFPVSFACLFRTSISRYRCRIFLSLSLPFMQSNSDFFSAKFKQSVRLDPQCESSIMLCTIGRYDDRKVNDLCRSFRYLISWWHAWKFMYRMHGLIIVYAPIAFNVNDVYIDDIYRYDWFVPRCSTNQSYR